MKLIEPPRHTVKRKLLTLVYHERCCQINHVEMSTATMANAPETIHPICAIQRERPDDPKKMHASYGMRCEERP